MRVYILALAAFSVTSLAHAASINSVKTGVNKVRSIEAIHCAKCIQETRKKVAPAAIELAPGTQKVELRTVDGVTKVYRTEAWLGGSPVVFVTKASDAMIAKHIMDKPAENVVAKADEKPVEQPAAADANMIDRITTTAAVTADMGAAIKVEPKAAFDASKLELRLD
ncbi:hypothetical protein IHQ71_05380 [Rhizobium sp. TH2]|uniref:plant virulence effector HPE1-like domain-containing protein n=1 Tax=Rhizobium sp. TH2 TaxID=2775403 RepID=UPI002157739B|nr:plant virulence effector HPE1-like domain-containing protein [Rhizobium sp. TH2]UVC10039.1 hypothetical protein IHQ71_05380 [Rhizobium sp. TH2]